MDSPKFLPGVIKRDSTVNTSTPPTPRRVLLRKGESTQSDTSAEPAVKRGQSHSSLQKLQEEEILLKSTILKSNRSEDDIVHTSRNKSCKVVPLQDEQEPDFIQKIKSEAKVDASKLMKEHSKGSYAKPTYIKLSHNHQVLQFGDLQSVTCVNGREIQLPLQIMVADISLVEDRTDRARQLDSREYHIWVFDKVHREGWDLTTTYENNFTTWLEGLQTLKDLDVDVANAQQIVKELAEIEVELRLWEYETNHLNVTRIPKIPENPSNFELRFKNEAPYGREHWKICDIASSVLKMPQ